MLTEPVILRNMFRNDIVTAKYIFMYEDSEYYQQRMPGVGAELANYSKYIDALRAANNVVLQRLGSRCTAEDSPYSIADMYWENVPRVDLADIFTAAPVADYKIEFYRCSFARLILCAEGHPECIHNLCGFIHFCLDGLVKFFADKFERPESILRIMLSLYLNERYPEHKGVYTLNMNEDVLSHVTVDEEFRREAARSNAVKHVVAVVDKYFSANSDLSITALKSFIQLRPVVDEIINDIMFVQDLHSDSSRTWISYLVHYACYVETGRKYLDYWVSEFWKPDCVKMLCDGGFMDTGITIKYTRGTLREFL